MFIATGQEKLTDEQYFLAKRAQKSGATVQFSMYDALPHSFATFFPRLPQSTHVLQRWGSFCRDVVRNPGELKSEWTRYSADDTEFKGTGLDLPVDFDTDNRERKMKEEIAKRKPWTGPTEAASL